MSEEGTCVPCPYCDGVGDFSPGVPCRGCNGRGYFGHIPVTPEHLAALRTVIAQWGYGAGDYDGFPNASVPTTLAELLAILEGES